MILLIIIRIICKKFSIITNKHFTIDDEDTLIDFIDEIFIENKDSSEYIKIQFYEQVDFSK